MKQDTLTNDLLQALLTAPDDAKRRALQSLRGEKPPADHGPLLLTVNQAAALLGTSRSTIWRAVRMGRLTKVAIYKGCERLRRTDVLALAGGAP